MVMNNMNNLDTALLDISYLRHDAHSICKKINIIDNRIDNIEHELKEIKKELRENIKEMMEMIKYMPGGLEYTKAKKDFEEKIE